MRLIYSDTDPFRPSTSGTCLHPTPVPNDPAAALEEEGLTILPREDAGFLDMFDAMQFALMGDAVAQANVVGLNGAAL